MTSRAPAVATTHCPDCARPLSGFAGEPPWCGRCEWNLGAFVPSPDHGILSRWIARLDHRAGFRADRLLPSLVESGRLVRSRPGGGQILLLVLSVIIYAIPVTAAVGAVLLFRTRTFGAVVLGIMLLSLAWTLRPRLGSLRRVSRNCHRPEPRHIQTLLGLIGRLADAVDAPRPDVVLLTGEWNAAAAVLGPRRRKVLFLGIPLLVSLERQEMAAVIAHELGHLRHQDSQRALLTEPALTLFGRLARSVRAPRLAAARGASLLILLAWKAVGTPLSWLLWTVHLGLNILGARDRRYAEARADLAAAGAAGTAAALSMLDATVLLPTYADMINGGGVAANRTVPTWRGRIRHARERASHQADNLRLYSIRAGASLFASHPAPGRRYQILSAGRALAATVTVTETEAARIDAELGPFAEALRKALAETYEM